jgi:hypothetical protein
MPCRPCTVMGVRPWLSMSEIMAMKILTRIMVRRPVGAGSESEPRESSTQARLLLDSES